MTIPTTDHGGDVTDQRVIKQESPVPMAAAANTPTKSNVKQEEDSTITQLSKSKSKSPSTSSQDNSKKSNRIRDRISPIQSSHLPLSKLEPVGHGPPGMCVSGERGMTAPKGLNIKSPTMVQAEQVQAGLEPKFPSFIKLMVRSHVASGFQLGFPASFCKSFLPKNDTIFVLEDENGEQFQLKYLALKTSLSGGWGSFVTEHKLLVGDVLIFQLVESYKFKVYIIRANDSREVDGTFGLLNLEYHTNENDAAEVAATTPPNKKKRNRQKSLTLTATQKKKRPRPSRSFQPPLDRPANVENSGTDGSDNPRFENIKSVTDLYIVVNGLSIDSELPEDVRMKYYELCCSKKAFLHDHLPQGLYIKLVAGIIGETVGIANSLKSCKVTTSSEDFAVWEKSLKSFELMGMKVGFLRERLHKLQSLVLESEGGLDTKKYVKAKSEQSRNSDEIRKFEAKLIELKEASGKFDAVIDTLKEKVLRHEAEFQELVDAPW